MLYLLENVKDGVVLASYNLTSRDDTDDVVESLSYVFTDIPRRYSC